MAQKPTTQETSYPTEATLYMAFELSKAKWRIRCSKGGRKAYERTIAPNDKQELQMMVRLAKEKLGLPEDARVVSCCEAGRDGFWPHRFLVGLGVENIVVDAASMEVNRRARRAKTDKIDVRKLLKDLVRFHRGDDDVWRLVRVPSEQAEDERRPHRELGRLKKERTQHRNRIFSLLATQGVHVMGNLNSFFENLDSQEIWNGQPLPEQLRAELEREHSRLKLVESQLSSIKASQREAVKNPTNAKQEKVAKLQTINGIGLDSAWLLEMELLGWRKFHNRREVGGSVGLGATPYDSGQSEREQGISKAGNPRVRERLIELAWLWLRYQPKSNITEWFNKRFSAGGKRAKKIGIVAVARRLLIQLWHFVEHDIVPCGAIVKA